MKCGLADTYFHNTPFSSCVAGHCKLLVAPKTPESVNTRTWRHVDKNTRLHGKNFTLIVVVYRSARCS